MVLGCPVPIVVAGGKKLSERDALWMAYKSIDQGAAGVDMGRNIFQAEHPVAMIQAVRAVVHDNEHPDQAFERYVSLKAPSSASGLSLAFLNLSGFIDTVSIRSGRFGHGLN